VCRGLGKVSGGNKPQHRQVLYWHESRTVGWWVVERRHKPCAAMLQRKLPVTNKQKEPTVWGVWGNVCVLCGANV